MERVNVLIERLVEQHQNKAGKNRLLVTAQLLLSELEKNNDDEERNVPSVVSIFYPSRKSNFLVDEIEPALPPVKEEIKINGEDVNEYQQYNKQEKPKQAESFYDPMTEIPTLALKQQEVNEAIAANGESLNDKLKSSSIRKEIGHSIKDTPIKDLRKAIGINDRYSFINELFRGDETMYERSIKTINSFNIYGEAELWIKRELKLKLAWSEESKSVQLFDQLVNRRFS